jgi:hypothetical protein
MKYHIKATVNYPETKVDTPDHNANSDGELLQWIMKLMIEPDATSFVVTIVKKEV